MDQSWSTTSWPSFLERRSARRHWSSFLQIRRGKALLVEVWAPWSLPSLFQAICVNSIKLLALWTRSPSSLSSLSNVKLQSSTSYKIITCQSRLVHWSRFKWLLSRFMLLLFPFSVRLLLLLVAFLLLAWKGDLELRILVTRSQAMEVLPIALTVT